MNKKQLIVAWAVFILFSNLSFAEEQEKFDLFPKNKGTIYEYSRDNIPETCFFPVDKAHWDGSKITAKEWQMLTDFQKITFINEYIQDKKQNEYKAIVKNKEYLDILNQFTFELLVILNKAASELDSLHSNTPMTMNLDAILFHHGKIENPAPNE